MSILHFLIIKNNVDIFNKLILLLLLKYMKQIVTKTFSGKYKCINIQYKNIFLITKAF